MKQQINKTPENIDGRGYEFKSDSPADCLASGPVSSAAFDMARLLEVCAAQIELAVRESNTAVDDLTSAFKAISRGAETIMDQAARVDGSEQRGLRESNGQLLENTHAAVIGLQFYDRLTQRLWHVIESLGRLAAVAGDPRLDSPNEWERIKDALRTSYSGETEKILFDALMAGSDTAQALQQLDDRQQDNENAGVELF